MLGVVQKFHDAMAKLLFFEPHQAMEYDNSFIKYIYIA